MGGGQDVHHNEITPCNQYHLRGLLGERRQGSRTERPSQSGDLTRRQMRETRKHTESKREPSVMAEPFKELAAMYYLAAEELSH